MFTLKYGGGIPINFAGDYVRFDKYLHLTVVPGKSPRQTIAEKMRFVWGCVRGQRGFAGR